jgi:salicylate hydroxylase
MAAALALEKVGIEPLVLERASVSREVGAGLGVAANAMRVLDHLGVGDGIRSNAVAVNANVWRGLERDEEIFAQRLAAMVDEYGGHYYCAHRADLLDCLAGAVDPARVRLSSNVVAVEDGQEEVLLTLQSGEQIAADLVVGADGLRSTVRANLFEEPEPRFTGFVTWRAIIPRASVPDRFERTLSVWLGMGRHAMLYPVRSESFNLSGFVPAGEVHVESWTNQADVTDLRQSFGHACHAFTDLFDSIETALITPLYFRDPLPTWSTERIVLLGDAAHPMPPSAGMGASMALEDAVTLAACLERNGAGDLGPALKEYQARRQQRTARMLVASRINLALFNESDPVRIRARNSRLRALQRLDPVGEATVAWQFSHDAVSAAKNPIPPSAIENPLARDEARQAFDLWRSALTMEDRAGLWPGERAGYERFLLERAEPAAFTLEELDCAGVPALRVSEPAHADAPAVLHLHGGGFVMGSARAAADVTGRIAARLGGWGLAVDYRLAPEHPYPAALEDALAAYEWLVEAHPSTHVVLSGEGAGGGLAISLAALLRDSDRPLPAALHVVSPFCDLMVKSPSTWANAGSDPWLNRVALVSLSAAYIGEADPGSPQVSPICADLRGLPPLLIHAASGEVLADDAIRLAGAAEAAGVDVTLRLIDDSVHSHLLFGFLPETEQTLDDLAELVERVCLQATGS